MNLPANYILINPVNKTLFRNIPENKHLITTEVQLADDNETKAYLKKEATYTQKQKVYSYKDLGLNARSKRSPKYSIEVSEYIKLKIIEFAMFNNVSEREAAIHLTDKLLSAKTETNELKTTTKTFVEAFSKMKELVRNYIFGI